MNEIKDDVPKSNSQRLRGALFIYYEQNDTGFSDFKHFYDNYMNQIINNVKAKLK